MAAEGRVRRFVHGEVIEVGVTIEVRGKHKSSPMACPNSFSAASSCAAVRPGGKTRCIFR